MKDFYYILGTRRNASLTEIDAAYEKLARKFYDEQDEFMDTHFREIAEAYDVLRDTSRRRKYDAAFKRNEKKQLAIFNLKYINIGLTLIFLLLTGLFALYVIRNLQGHSKKSAVKPSVQASPATIFVYPKKHHKAAGATLRKPLTTKTIIQQAENKTSFTPVIIPVPKPAIDSSNMATIHANITGIVYLHESPDINSEVVAKIPDEAQVRILEKGQAWYKVSYQSKEGYVLKSTLNKP